MIDNENKVEWYVVNTYAGHEKKVKEKLEKRIESMDIKNNLLDILIAEEEELTIKGDKEKSVMKNLFPGYLFVKMIMTDESWYVVRNTPGVTGFIGSSGGGAKPFPVSHDEMESLLRRIGRAGKRVNVSFEVGSDVKIVTGPLAGTVGKIHEMNDDTQIVKLRIMSFGQEIFADLTYNDIELDVF